MLKYAKEPCPECPWRTDVPPGKFPPERFQAPAPTAYDMSVKIFACHMARGGFEYGCAGYMLQQSVHNLIVRMLRANASDIRAACPLFENYRAMAIANGVDADDPALVLCRDDGQWPWKDDEQQ